MKIFRWEKKPLLSVHTYHRLENEHTQTPEIAKLQEDSKEIWGSPPSVAYWSGPREGVRIEDKDDGHTYAIY